MLQRGEQFPHNYNAVSRSAFYTWLNKHFKLGASEPVIERDYEPLTREQLTVWDADHPAPKADDAEFERRLLKWFTDDATKQLKTLSESPKEFHKVVGEALATIIGRTYATAGEVEWEPGDKQDRGDYLQITGLLHNTTYGEELPVVWLFPRSWNQKAVVWLDDAGMSCIYDENGAVKPAVLRLVNGGTAVVSADLLYQGEFLKDGKPIKQTHVVTNPREAAAYTFGYNDSLFAERTHDILTIVKFLRSARVDSYPNPSSIGVAGFGCAGSLVLAASAVAGDAIDSVAADTGGFRFGKLLDYRDPQFLPGGAKYFDLPGMIAVSKTQRVWLAGEPGFLEKTDNKTDTNYSRRTIYQGGKSTLPLAAANWLSK